MGLYLKKYLNDACSIEDGFILNEKTLDTLKLLDSYPAPYCWEADIINKIKENEDFYFDFSKNFIDIGAGCGEYCSILNFENNYVFEPDKEMMWICCANLVNQKKVKNSYTYQTALNDSNDEIEIFTNGTLEHSVVTAKTLDYFNIPNVGFIKIDVEGFEEKVIRGGLITIISNNYPPILFECWPVGYWGMTQEKHDNLFNLLKTLGYEIFEYWGDFETHLAVHKSQLKNNQ